MNARLIWRHPHHTHKWPQRYRMPVLIASYHCFRVQRPGMDNPMAAFMQTQALIYGMIPPRRRREAVCAWTDRAYLNFKSHAGLRAAYRDGADERVPVSGVQPEIDVLGDGQRAKTLAELLRLKNGSH